MTKANPSRTLTETLRGVVGIRKNFRLLAFINTLQADMRRTEGLGGLGGSSPRSASQTFTRWVPLASEPTLEKAVHANRFPPCRIVSAERTVIEITKTKDVQGRAPPFWPK